MISSDLLALLNIFVTIIVGFYITHWYSVRDTRIRALKNYYISVLSEVRAKVDEFFRNILDGKANSKDITKWYSSEESFIINFDDGVRLSLPIKKARLQDVIFNVHSEITGYEYMNDHFSDVKLELDNQTREWVIRSKKKIDTAINEYLIQINNSSAYGIWHMMCKDIKFDTEYYKEIEKCSYPWVKAVGRFVWINGMPFLL